MSQKKKKYRNYGLERAIQIHIPSEIRIEDTQFYIMTVKDLIIYSY